MRTTLLRVGILAGCIAGGLAVVHAAEPRTYQTTGMFQAGNPAIQKFGGATLYRSSQGLEMRVATSGLDMNSSYTVWWVIFNNPSACVGGCGADDLPENGGNPAVHASVLYAAGFVTGLSDTGNVTAHLEAGAPAAGVDVESGNGLEPGNGFRAEVHLVVRSHGLTSLGAADGQQIGTFNGGCNPTCANKQAARFQPVQ
jgi:hypothetical protein